MASNWKNLMPFDGDWMIELLPEEASALEASLEHDQLRKHTSSKDFPREVGIMPIRNAVTFPGTVTPLAVGRPSSRKLLESGKPGELTIGLLTQRKADVEDPDFDDLYKVGTLASVLKVVKLPQGSMHLVVHGLMRFKVVSPVATEPYLRAKIKPVPSKISMTKEVKALMVNVRNSATRVIALSPNVPEEAAVLLENIEDPASLADFLAANLNVEIAKKQQLLEEADAAKRLEAISMALAQQLEVLELSNKIQGRVRESVDKTQREYYLQEQLKAIQSELGQEDRRTEEINELRQCIEKAQMPEKVKDEVLRELDRLAKIPAASPDHTVLRTYLEWICQLPWSKQSSDQLSIPKARRILNKDHYNLAKVKKRILEFLAVRKLNPTGKSPILCFIGPPGVGKTSLGQSIARAMGRQFVRISLGGMRDEAEIRGHRRTYIGALPGRIMQELRKCKTRNPVFMLDELDKLGSDFRGDPASALLEVLDPEQNSTFTDHYIDLPFDLSKVMFIGTANYDEPIPPALQDRMEILELPGYTTVEKVSIGKKYLLPRQFKENGLGSDTLKITDDALLELIRGYSREAGVRELERNIAGICRAVAAKVAEGKIKKAKVDVGDISKILGPVRYESELAMRTSTPGVATALAYTPYGGELLFIETLAMPGKGEMQLTGQIGEVMKESAEAAFSLVKSQANVLGIDPELFNKNDFHVHVPEGAIPKDGPSAGTAMYVSLASLLLGKKVRTDVAMTGEITLRGLVLPIGGLKEKVLAAKQTGIKLVILPKRNQKDMPEVPSEAKKGMKFKYVDNAAQVLTTALGLRTLDGGKRKKRRRPKKKS